jgi:hypothetical protein
MVICSILILRTPNQFGVVFVLPVCFLTVGGCLGKGFNYRSYFQHSHSVNQLPYHGRKTSLELLHTEQKIPPRTNNQKPLF